MIQLNNKIVYCISVISRTLLLQEMQEKYVLKVLM